MPSEKHRAIKVYCLHLPQQPLSSASVTISTIQRDDHQSPSSPFSLNLISRHHATTASFANVWRFGADELQFFVDKEGMQRFLHRYKYMMYIRSDGSQESDGPDGSTLETSLVVLEQCQCIYMYANVYAGKVQKEYVISKLCTS
ncbi:hypothetical protein L2E82_24475 [Cichorium intybus]|uniref:Uncharacterized protein n=1 Tax=Cichorium intybus TaxID=13427 RepID=A0ACB9E1A6_CICIN|nr:hypothetical protein L2E82_24475 [Cichorium intybus]